MVTTEYLSFAELSHETWTRQRTSWPVAVSPLAAVIAARAQLAHRLAQQHHLTALLAAGLEQH
ncbi:hypothetical protein ACWD4N_46345, partial [Streptomyces sp. NPDC002586]